MSTNEVKIPNIESDKLTVIFADIQISNVSASNINYNLNEYRLSLYDKLSSKIYIDSLVDYIIAEKTLGSKKSINKSVYWVFDGVLTKDDLRNIKLVRRAEGI